MSLRTAKIQRPCTENELCQPRLLLTLVSTTVILMSVNGLVKVTGIFYKVFTTVFNAQHWYIGLMVSIKDAGSYLISPLAGALCIRFGHLRVIGGGLILSSIGVLISAFAPNIHVLVITFGLITGIGFGFINSPSYSLISIVFDVQRNLALTIVISCVGSMHIFYPIFVNFINNLYGIWGTLIIIAGLFFQNITCCCIIFLCRVNVHTPQERERIFKFNLLKNRDVILLIIGNFFYAIADAIPYTIIPHQAILNGYDDFFSDSLLSFMGIASLISRLIVPIIISLSKNEINFTFAYGLILLLLACPLVMIILSDSKMMMILTVIIHGSLQGLQNSLYFPSILGVIGSKQITIIIGYIYFAIGLGVLISSPLSGFIYDLTNGYEFAALVASLATAICGIIHLYESRCFQTGCKCERKDAMQETPEVISLNSIR